MAHAIFLVTLQMKHIPQTAKIVIGYMKHNITRKHVSQ